MAYIWDIKKILEIIDSNKEYEYLFDANQFEELRRAMEEDGYYVTKQFLTHIIRNVLEIDLDNGVIVAGDMKYTIVGTDPENRYRYAGVNNHGNPCTLTMGENREYRTRVYFKDMTSAQEFFDKFIEYPKIKNRENPVKWKIIPISKRNSLGHDFGKGVEMKLTNSSIGPCYQVI